MRFSERIGAPAPAQMLEHRWRSEIFEEPVLDGISWWFNGGFMGFYGGFMAFNGGLIGSNGNVNGIWLVVEPTPLKNMTSSVGMMKFPMYGKIIQMFQNHQPVFFFLYNQQNQD